MNDDLKPFAELIEEVFSSLQDCIGRLEDLDDWFGRVSALVLIKARNLALGCYSLCLDALAQEAGALFRPLLESLELLTYLRLDPTRIEEAVNGRLPKAGIIARRINGKLKGLRDYLNAHASHLSLSPEAMGHLVDLRAGRFRPVQAYNLVVLRENLCTLLEVLILLSIEAANCTSVGAGRVDSALGDRVEDIKRRGLLLVDQATG